MFMEKKMKYTKTGKKQIYVYNKNEYIFKNFL